MQKGSLIYGLTNGSGDVFYVGGTNDLRRRLNEHKKRLGYLPHATVLELTGPDWRDAEHRWIEKFRGDGVPLTNKTAAGGGYQTHGEHARRLLSEAAKGKPKTAEHRANMSTGRKGLKYDWTEEGVARATTRFQPGENTFERMSEEAQAKHRKDSSERAKALPSEERSRRNSVAWANMTEEQRVARGRAIAEGQREWREGFREQNAANRRAYWAKKTPEERKAISVKMIEARERSRAAKRNAK
jgi:hypothetical protein